MLISSKDGSLENFPNSLIEINGNLTIDMFIDYKNSYKRLYKVSLPKHLVIHGDIKVKGYDLNVRDYNIGIKEVKNVFINSGLSSRGDSLVLPLHVGGDLDINFSEYMRGSDLEPNVIKMPERVEGDVKFKFNLAVESAFDVLSLLLPQSVGGTVYIKGGNIGIEDIEILRFLELGFDVNMIEVSGSSIAVDIPEDVTKVEAALNAKP